MSTSKNAHIRLIEQKRRFLLSPSEQRKAQGYIPSKLLFVHEDGAYQLRIGFFDPLFFSADELETVARQLRLMNKVRQ